MQSNHPPQQALVALLMAALMVLLPLSPAWVALGWWVQRDHLAQTQCLVDGKPHRGCKGACVLHQRLQQAPTVQHAPAIPANETPTTPIWGFDGLMSALGPGHAEAPLLSHRWANLAVPYLPSLGMAPPSPPPEG